MQKITGTTLWLGTINEEPKNPERADIGLTINKQQHQHLLNCLQTGADINIHLTPETWGYDPAGGMELRMGD